MLSASDLLSRNDFAKAVLSRLQQLGASVIPHYDELSFIFYVDVSTAASTIRSGHLRLEQWYERYKEALLDGRGQRAIDDVAHHWMQLLTHAEADYALDTSRMVPLIRSRFDFIVSALQGEVYGEVDSSAAIDELAWRPFGDHLVVVLAEDTPHAWRHATHTQLRHAGLAWEAALALAMKNLPRLETAFRNPSPFIQSEGNIWVPASRQSPHNAAWLLWPDRLRGLPVAGQHVAFAPFAHTLAITGTENYAELARLAATTMSLAKTIADKALTAVPLILDGNQWRPWLPPATHPLYGRIRELWCLHENSLYSEQTKLLKRKFEGNEDAPYIASYNVAAVTLPSGEKKYFTMAVWTETVSTLLPKADEVMLKKLLNRAELDADENAEPQFGEHITVPWQDLARHLGEKLQPQGMYPERYLVRGEDFPTGPQWEGLALAQVDFPENELDAAAAPESRTTVPVVPGKRDACPTPASPAPAPAGLLGGLSPAARPAPTPAVAPPPGLPPGITPRPHWQPPAPAGKHVPLAPARRPPMWPIILAVAIPVVALFMILLGVSLFIYWSHSRSRATVAQRVHPVGGDPDSSRERARTLTPPEVIEPPAPRPPAYIIKLPWTEIEDFPELGKPEKPLPRLMVNKNEAMPAGRDDRPSRDEFVAEAPEGGWLVGFRLTRGRNWGGAIRSLTPIWQVEDKYQLGKLCGSEGGEAQTQVVAAPGYAVGKIESRAGLVNNAVRLTFYRIQDERLDPDDSYATGWLGSEGGGEMAPIGGRGEAIVGIGGTYRRDDDVVSIRGLVYLPLPKVEKSLPKSTGKARLGPATEQRFGSRAGDEGPEGCWLVGLRVFQGKSWGGAPLAIQPIYQVEDRYVLGTRLGKEGGELHEWIAPPGYAVGEIWADQGLVVHRLQLRYQRVGRGSLDTSDAEESPRLGPQGGEQHCLSSDGKPIVGLNAELSHDVSSVGIVVAE